MWFPLLLSIICFGVALFEAREITANNQRNIICKQAYAAKVDDKMEACRAWKALIDEQIKEVNGKLVVKE